MKDIRRKEKKIKSKEEIIYILKKTKYITIAMCTDNVPYLVTLTHCYDSKNNSIYFHCAKEGKKIDILKQNNVVWGQALIDNGYVEGKCDHLYATTQFKGTITFIEDFDEKIHALKIMIKQQETVPDKVFRKQITKDSLKKVNIGRIDISYLSGKKSDKVYISK
jgi:nitroimidazol reductase NimA-like FMN-containing flavoprotein (pyridoxamine 5'-phosphate oxidase superfamily)